MARTSTQELFDRVGSAVAVGVSTARKVAREVKEALRIDLGRIMFDTYSSHLALGHPEVKARELTLQLAQAQLDLQIEESKKAVPNG